MPLKINAAKLSSACRNRFDAAGNESGVAFKKSSRARSNSARSRISSHSWCDKSDILHLYSVLSTPPHPIATVLMWGNGIANEGSTGKPFDAGSRRSRFFAARQCPLDSFRVGRCRSRRRWCRNCIPPVSARFFPSGKSGNPKKEHGRAECYASISLGVELPSARFQHQVRWRWADS